MAEIIPQITQATDSTKIGRSSRKGRALSKTGGSLDKGKILARRAGDHRVIAEAVRKQRQNLAGSSREGGFRPA